MIVEVRFDSAEVKARLGTLTAEMMEKGKKGMVRVTTEVRNRAKQRLRWRKGKGAGEGGRFTARLATSIVPKVTLSETAIEGEVKAGVPYAKYVEGWNKANQHVPVRRHFVSFETAPGLRDWARRHGILTHGRRVATLNAATGARGSYYRMTPLYLGKGMMVGGPDSITPFLEPSFKEVIPDAAEYLAGEIRVG